MSNIASRNFLFAVSVLSLDLKCGKLVNHTRLFICLPKISVQDHYVLQLDLLHPVPVDQGVKVSMEYKDKTHQDDHPAVKLQCKTIKFN